VIEARTEASPMSHIGSGGTSRGARALILVVGLAWGMNWVATRILLQSLPPLTIRALAVALGAIVLFAAAAVRGDPLGLPNGERTKVAIAGFFNVTLFNGFSVYSQVFGSTSRAIVIAYSMPIWASLLGHYVLKEKTSPWKLVGLGLCAAGLFVLIFPGIQDGLPLGAAFALGCALTWAAGTVYQKKVNVALPLLCSTAWQLLLSSAVLASGMVWLEGLPHLADFHFTTTIWLFYSGVFAMGFAYLIWFVVLGKLPTTTAAIGTLLAPIVGVVASITINGEHPGWVDTIGFTLMFAAAAAVLLEPKPREDVPCGCR
jgi:drug/metabolite transporter (DMT)-like permease